jgi:hypothetical protein
LLIGPGAPFPQMLSSLAIIATALGALVFVTSYAWLTRGNWKHSLMGLHVMAFMIVILTVSSLAVATLFFGTEWPYRDYIRAGAWGMVAGVIWWRVVLLFRAQHRHRGGHGPHPGHD